jgi:hypothetical protein
MDIPMGKSKILWIPWDIIKEYYDIQSLNSGIVFKTAISDVALLPHHSTIDRQPFVSHLTDKGLPIFGGKITAAYTQMLWPYCFS